MQKPENFDFRGRFLDKHSHMLQYGEVFQLFQAKWTGQHYEFLTKRLVWCVIYEKLGAKINNTRIMR